MLDFLFLLLFLYLAFIAIVGSIALYGKVIDRISEENQARAAKIHGFVMKALKFALAFFPGRDDDFEAAVFTRFERAVRLENVVERVSFRNKAARVDEPFAR